MGERPQSLEEDTEKQNDKVENKNKRRGRTIERERVRHMYMERWNVRVSTNFINAI